MKAWKRCFAALLAFIMMFTSANVSFAAGKLDAETNVWSATAADIVAEHYGLASNPRLVAVLCNAAIDTGAAYQAAAPYQNGTSGKEDLLAVDYRSKTFYVQSYEETEGYAWLPVEAVLIAEGQEQESFALTESVSFYNDVEYYASQAFTYQGNSYTIQVTYQLELTLDTDEQQRLLDIPAHIGQSVKNVDKTLSGMWYYLDEFGGMIPSLYALLSMSTRVEKTVVTTTEVEGKKVESTATEIVEEPFFDPEEHAAEIAAIQALYNEYMSDPADPKLDMFTVCDNSLSSSDSSLRYAMDHGAEIKETAAALYEKLAVLSDSVQLNSIYVKLKDLAPDLYASLKNFYKRLNKFVGTAGSQGDLAILKDDANWTMLDPEVQAAMFREEYTAQDFAQLEAAASGLRNVTYEAPTADDQTMVAAEVTLSCDIITYDITVTAYAKVVGEGVGNQELQELPTYTGTITLLEGTTPEEVELAVKELGLEDDALNGWNGLNSAYEIAPGPYLRSQTLLTEPLQSNVADYGIWYEPNYYELKTDFAGKLKVPYGYQMEFPICTEEDGWYDYVVTLEDGSKVTYNQGYVYTVKANAEVARTTGAAKFEYRLLDYLAEDQQYDFSDEAKRILLSSAIESPVLKIRVPDGSTVTEIEKTDGGFYIKADDYPSGMAGMSWKPYIATLMDGDSVVEEVLFSNGKASWTTAGFTHVNVSYCMQVTRVKSGFASRELTSEEIEEYANLPHTLVQEIDRQHQALSGSGENTAKTVYQKMASKEKFMKLLPRFYEKMETDAGRNAVLQIQGQEDEKVKGVNGEILGKGGWSATSDELAIYKYLKLCAGANWSVAAYYQMEKTEEMSDQALLLANCLEAMLVDPGVLDFAEEMEMLEDLEQIKGLPANLRELADGLRGPNEYLLINNSQFASLISEILQAKGKTQSYSGADSLYAYRGVSRNGENAGSLFVSVQVGNYEKNTTIGYALETVEGSERYHLFTDDEASALQQMLAEMKRSCGYDENKAVFYDLSATTVPAAGAKLGVNETVSFIYTPKTYTVTISGVSTAEYMETFQYGSDYVIDLPAKSQKTNAKTYYRYILPDENGDLLAEFSVENGTTASFAFTEDQLPALFPAGGYVIYREELKTEGKPFLTLKPKLSNEKIRGYEVDNRNEILFLDVHPDGINMDEYLEQVVPAVENANLRSIEIYDATGLRLGSYSLISTGSTVRYLYEDVYRKLYEKNYLIVMMGDVNGDGRNTDADVSQAMEIYFLEKNKKGEYIEPFPLDEAAALAANMNNNKTIDSNDAWIIRSKALYWNADKKQSQIIYRSVLR